MTCAAAQQDIDPARDLRASWQAYIDFGIANPMLFALLSDPEHARNSRAAQSGKQVLRLRIHRLTLSGQLHVSEERAVDLIHAAGTGAVLTLLAMPPHERDLDLADDLFDAVLDRILTTNAAAETRVDATNDLISSAVAVRAATPTLDMLSNSERQLLTEWLDRTIKALSGIAGW